MKGRRPSTEPALAWDYRRAITLVQVLAKNNPVRRQGLIVLASEWDIVANPAYLFELSDIEIAHRLAVAALEAAKRGDE